MVIQYDRSSDRTIEEKLDSLTDQIQLAFNEMYSEIYKLKQEIAKLKAQQS